MTQQQGDGWHREQDVCMGRLTVDAFTTHMKEVMTKAEISEDNFFAILILAGEHGSLNALSTATVMAGTSDPQNKTQLRRLAAAVIGSQLLADGIEMSEIINLIRAADSEVRGDTVGPPPVAVFEVYDEQEATILLAVRQYFEATRRQQQSNGTPIPEA